MFMDIACTVLSRSIRLSTNPPSSSAASSLLSCTIVSSFGHQKISLVLIVSPNAFVIASPTIFVSLGSDVMTRLPSSSSSMSVAPASRAESIASSTPIKSFGSKTTLPRFSNKYAQGVALPPASFIASLTSESVLNRESVSHSMMTATLFGNIPSTVTFSRLAPVVLLPCPRAIAASMDAFAKPSFLHLAIKSANRGFNDGSCPNNFDAVAISCANIDRWRFFRASFFPLSCFIFDHRL